VIVDCHIHLYGERENVIDHTDSLLRYGDRLGIEKFIVCLGPQLIRQPDAQRLEDDTEYVLAAMQHAPERIEGLVYGSGNHTQKSLELMERYIANGPMKGVKLWMCRRCCDVELDPIAEYASELDVPILQHSYWRCGEPMDGETQPYDMTALARRHPNTQFLMAHCGGNWEKGIRSVADQPNVAVDVCGGDPEAGQTEYAVEYLGADRVLFGSDASGRSLSSQLAKVTGAQISDADRAKVLGENAVMMFRL
jgi:predicted TIM-barrel fold metal-dependent hydrolase